MTVFFGGPDPKTGEIKLGGTGFLVVHKEDGYGFGYLVTARHVAKKVRPHGDVIVRVNKKGEDAVNFTVKDIYWAYHTDETVDVAVTPCNIDQNEFDVVYYNLADLVRPSAAPFAFNVAIQFASWGFSTGIPDRDAIRPLFIPATSRCFPIRRRRFRSRIG